MAEIYLDKDEIKQLLKIARLSGDTVKFTTEDNKLFIWTMNEANTVAVIWERPAKGEFNFAVDGKILATVLSRFVKHDAITLDVGESILTISDKNRTFKINLNAEVGKLPKFDKVKHTAKITVFNSDVLADLFSDAGAISDIVEFTVKDGLLTVRAKGDTIEFLGEADVEMADIEGKAKAKFQSNYLLDALKLTEPSEIHLGKDQPMKIIGQPEIGTIEIWIAPTVE